MDMEYHSHLFSSMISSISFYSFPYIDVVHILLGFPSGSVIKNLPVNAGDAGSILGLGGFTGEGNDNPLQYSCLENPMDRGAWWATVHGVTVSDRTE